MDREISSNARQMTCIIFRRTIRASTALWVTAAGSSFRRCDASPARPGLGKHLTGGVFVRRVAEGRSVMQLAMVSTYPPQSCGIGTYTSYLAGELVQAGCDATVLTEWPGRPLGPSGLDVRPCFDGEADYVDRIVDAV